MAGRRARGCDDRQRRPRLPRRIRRWSSRRPGRICSSPATIIDIVEDPPGSGLFDASLSEPPLHGDPPGTGLYVFGTWIPGDYCPINWEMSFAREDITTRVLIGRPDMDEPIVLDDDNAQEIYGVETIDLTDLETTLDTEMTQIGNRLLVTRGHTTAPRVAGVTLNGATSPDMVNLLATADPRTPSRFHCRHISGDRLVFSRLMFCTAVRHTITPDLWEARLSLDDALPWQVGADRRILERHRNDRCRPLGRDAVAGRHHTMRSN